MTFWRRSLEIALPSESLLPVRKAETPFKDLLEHSQDDQSYPVTVDAQPQPLKQV